MRLAMEASSRKAALRAAAELQAEGYVANISIRGRSYLLHIEYDDGDEAAIIRRCETLGYAPP